MGFSDLLAKNIHNFSTTQIEDLASTINAIAVNTNTLLNEILIWAKSQQGKIPFKPQKLLFRDLYKETIDVLKHSADLKHININYLASDSLMVFGDKDLLKAILRNLVSNAIKFTNTGGKITINAEPRDGNILISVIDNGVGIAPDSLTKLFEITEVVSTPGTAKESGTGLGLLLCKDFVERHKGKIWVESNLANGSEFKFTLPV